ncbi:MAG: polyisoprenoid-binding protein [Gemmatimonadales bacterium]|nr:MAG: polyisoprenoid-binding protein [Gemmatimonadales bacterium]
MFKMPQHSRFPNPSRFMNPLTALLSRSRAAGRSLAPRLTLALTATALLVAVPAGAQTAWNVDSAHTEVNFKVNHFFTPVSGTFHEYEIDLNYDPENPAASSVDVRISVASVDTGNSDRDEHLRSEDFFEADAHPYMTFRSTSVRDLGNGSLMATGPLTMKGITQEVELPIRVLGMQELDADMQQMLGGVQRVAGFSAETRLRRQDFGVGVGSWAATLVVGGNVDVEILLEANQR